METPPIAIVVTWGKDLIEYKGGLLSFIRHFEKEMSKEGSLWLNKSRMKPKHDVLYVYVIIHNQVRYKLYYGGYETGVTDITNGDGKSWSYCTTIRWSRIVLGGPFVKAPYKIPMRGFQGFRYLTEELF